MSKQVIGTLCASDYKETFSINHQGGNVEQVLEDVSGTLTASMNSSGNNKLSVGYKVGTLCASGYPDKLTHQDVMQGLYPVVGKDGKLVNGTMWDGSDICPTLTARNAGGAQRMPDKDNFNGVIDEKNMDYIIRRLTPLECERLQGFPDYHTDVPDEKGKPASDANRYKALGNSVAVPCVEYIMEGFAEQGVKSLGSLFDGISGFCLAGIINEINPVWASEIEAFPIRVAKAHFGDDDSGTVGDYIEAIQR